MNQRDRETLWHEIRRELMMNTNPYSYPQADPWDSGTTVNALMNVVNSIMDRVDEYVRKVEDEIHRRHHE